MEATAVKTAGVGGARVCNVLARHPIVSNFKRYIYGFKRISHNLNRKWIDGDAIIMLVLARRDESCFGSIYYFIDLQRCRTAFSVAFVWVAFICDWCLRH